MEKTMDEMADKAVKLFGYDFNNSRVVVKGEFINSYMELLAKIEKLEAKLTDLEITQKYKK